MRPSKLVLLILFISSLSVLPAGANPLEQSDCLKRVAPLKVKREKVAEYDGVWGLFQKSSEFQDNSVQGISLDNKINSILFHLDYLCETKDGIPFDELSYYVSNGLKEKGAEEFKKELINLGKSEGEIEVWFRFSKFAVANRYRLLDLKQIYHTIYSAQPFINSYLKLAERIYRKEDMSTVIQITQNLTNQIESFFTTDPYMSKAIYENAQVPYADFDENYGGS
jgi:hypothetical protein